MAKPSGQASTEISLQHLRALPCSVRSFQSVYTQTSLTLRCTWRTRTPHVFRRLLLHAARALLLVPCRCTLAGTAADVHWLNSLKGGQACLLVDSYRDLRDGEAFEEAFSLIEVCSRYLSGSLNVLIGVPGVLLPPPCFEGVITLPDAADVSGP